MCAHRLGGVTALGDEDRRELPHRVRGAARAGPAPPAQPALSEEVRQRIQAAVQAERGEAVGPDQELASDPERRVTASGPARTDAASPVINGVDRAIESQRPVPPIESRRTAEPAAPKRPPDRRRLTALPSPQRLSARPSPLSPVVLLSPSNVPSASPPPSLT